MLRNLAVMLVAGLWTTVLLPFALLSILITGSGAPSIWLARRVWSPVFFWAGGTRLQVEGLEHVDRRRPTVFLSNHQSTADIPTLFRALPTDLRFVAKSQLRWVPVVGWYLWAAGHVLIDRSNTKRAIASLDEAAAKIRRGISIIMYAEGTRSDDGTILPFKKGPFALAMKAGVVICPVTIEGSGVAMPKNSWRITPGTIRVKIGAPIDTREYTEAQREQLIRRVRNVIIDQSLQLGGKGGDRDDAVAARGREGASELDGRQMAVT